MPEQVPPPEAAETVYERLAEATPEQVARAIFAAVPPPDPRQGPQATKPDPATSPR